MSCAVPFAMFEHGRPQARWAPRWLRSRGLRIFTCLGVTSVPGSIGLDKFEICDLLGGLRMSSIIRNLGLRRRDEAGFGTSIPSRT